MGHAYSSNALRDAQSSALERSLWSALRALETGNIIPVRIFGTDISDTAIGAGRAGRYSIAEVSGVSSERLGRFFFKTEDGYMVQKPIRDMCVFAQQNVIGDSPFSRLDLISCRNLMIYLRPRLQRKLIPVFHYSLVRTGYLFLGSSESIGAHAELFRLVDRRFRIYSRKSSPRRTNLDFPVNIRRPVRPSKPLTTSHGRRPRGTF